MEADLVAHCGTRAEGPYLSSLVLTDVATGWTECLPLLRHGYDDVLRALDQVRGLLPFPLRGLDTDNGGEFLNFPLLAVCRRERRDGLRDGVPQSGKAHDPGPRVLDAWPQAPHGDG